MNIPVKSIEDGYKTLFDALPADDTWARNLDELRHREFDIKYVFPLPRAGENKASPVGLSTIHRSSAKRSSSVGTSSRSSSNSSG